MAEAINEFPCISSRMKLQAVIGGYKIGKMDYRFIFFHKAVELGCKKFFSCISNSDGLQELLVRLEGNDDKISNFKDFMEDKVHEDENVSFLAFEEYITLI